jgi:uncharacterized protein
MTERRYIPDRLEARQLDDGLVIEGHASMFDTPYELSGFVEQVARGAFKKSLKEGDVAALWNHDPNFVLGRSRSKTLELTEDEVGLHYRVSLPDTQAARDLYTLIERGDVYQSSFAFEVVKEDWAYPKRGEEGLPTRTLKEVRLWDVSPVLWPAAPSTDVDIARAVRSLAEAMGVSPDAQTVPELMARNAEVETTPDPEPEPELHSEPSPEPDDLLYL